MVCVHSVHKQRCDVGGGWLCAPPALSVRRVCLVRGAGRCNLHVHFVALVSPL